MAALNRNTYRSKPPLGTLADLVEHIAVGIALVDKESHFVYVNRSFATLHGYGPNELIGQPLLVLYPADNLINTVLADLETEDLGEFSAELVHVRRDGSSFPVLRSSSLIVDKTGSSIGTAIVVRDISEDKIVEDLASESHARQVADLKGSIRELADQLEQSRVQLRQHARRLRNADEALRLMISQLETCRKDTEQTLYRNIAEAVFPILDRLKTRRLPADVKHLLTSLEFNLKSLSLDPGHLRDKELTVLSPLEIRICELIGCGLTSKQIADTTGVSEGTVNAHRFNIRRKLGFVGSGRPLSTHLRQKFLQQAQ